MVNIGVAAYNIDNIGIKAMCNVAGKTTSKDDQDGQPEETQEKEVQKKEQEEEKKR